MASKLFRAVVAVGIALGAAATACSGGSTDGDDGAGEGSPAAGERGSSASPGPGSPSGSGGPDGSATVGGDAQAGDAAPPRDAAPDAFCDSAWPTTKGKPPPSCIDQNGECADAGAPGHCGKPSGNGTCDRQHYATLCVGGRWECGPGTVPLKDCK